MLGEDGDVVALDCEQLFSDMNKEAAIENLEYFFSKSRQTY